MRKLKKCVNQKTWKQLTNWRDDFISEVRKRWDGEIFYSNGDDKFGRGVAILTKKKGRDIKCKIMFKDTVGKCMAVEIEYEERKVVVVNVHAPTGEQEKTEYLKFLREFVKKHSKVIIMGDFNTVFS